MQATNFAAQEPCMRKLFVLFLALTATTTAFSQAPKEKNKKFNLSNRAGDHFMLQLSSDRWMGIPDSIDRYKKGLSRGGNIYLMLDKPFKGNPRFSAGIGIGVGTSSMFFEKLDIGITGTTPVLQFNPLDTLGRFKKYKLTTAYLEIPVELRFTSNPEKPNKTFKAAIGVKVGTLLKASTKGKNLQDASGRSVNDFTQKLSSKSYFNTTRLAATARIGYGYFSLFGSYNITAIFKDGVAEDMKLLQLGLTISGL